MAINYAGRTFDNDWFPINGQGERQGDKDWAANAAWAAETQGQNPYTNAPGASQYDKSGAIPGNEPGSTLPPVAAPVANTWSTGTPGTASTNPMAQSVRDTITRQLASPGTVNTADPAYRQSVQANEIQTARGAERAKMANAQRMHAQGMGDSGALDAAQGRIDTQWGEKNVGFEAELMRSFLDAERQKISQALALGAGIMSADEERALRAQLASIQERLGYADIDFRRDALGQQSAYNLAALNQQAMLALFGGG